MSRVDQDLEKVIQRRKQLRADLERLKGRKEQAEETLKNVEEEIRAKGIEPSQIDEKLEQFEDKYRKLVDTLTQDTDAAEKALTPYLKGTNP